LLRRNDRERKPPASPLKPARGGELNRCAVDAATKGPSDGEHEATVHSDKLRAIALPSVPCAILAQSTSPPRAAFFSLSGKHRNAVRRVFGDPRHVHLSLGAQHDHASSIPPQYMVVRQSHSPVLQLIGLVMPQNSPATNSHQKGYTLQNISIPL
jgi:hypothetical protein